MSSHPRKSEPAPPREIKAPFERAFERILTPFEQFIHNEAASGIVLIACALLALVLANSFLAQDYLHALETPIRIGIGSWTLEKTVHHWVNDGLMTLFFFVVGLEIKREILVGELADVRQAVLPIAAAVGGMVVPALIYYAVNPHGYAAQGWGIPMATDIAFAVGVLVLLGSRVPQKLLTFLVALAIVDDLGAVVVIAIFYTSEIDLIALGIAAGLFGVLVLLNLIGVRKPFLYFFVAVFLWLAMLKSGVHATLAGVLTAMAIPARPKFDQCSFTQHTRALMDRFEATHQPGVAVIGNEEQRGILQTLEHTAQLVQTPLQRLEHLLHMPVSFFIIPVFALTNAGVPIDFTSLAENIAHPVTLGVVLGLVLGKTIGISSFSWLVWKLGIGRLPAGTRFSHIVGVAMIGGIGFTMSIFIAELGFAGHPEYLVMAKTGILLASICAGGLGLLWLVFALRSGRSGKSQNNPS